MSSRLLPFLIVAAAVLLLAPPASADVRYGPPVVIGGSQSAPVLATGPNGPVTLVWDALVDIDSTIQSARMLNDGAFSAPQTIATATPPSVSTAGSDLFAESAVVDPFGRATAIYRELYDEPATSVPQNRFGYAQIAADGVGAPPRQPAGTETATNPVAAVDATGVVTIAWHAADGGLELQRISAAGEPGAVERVAISTGNEGAREFVPIGIAPGGGEQYLTWIRDERVFESLRLTGGGGERRHPLFKNSRSGHVEYTDPVVSGRRLYAFRWVDGEADAVVSAALNGKGRLALEASLRPQALPQRLRVATSSRGTVIAAWTDDFDVRSAALSGRAPARVTTLTPGDPNGTGANLVIDPRGRATVVWRGRFEREKDKVQAVRLSARGKPGKVRQISSGNSEGPVVAIDLSGRAVVSWLQQGDVVAVRSLAGR